MTAHPRAEKPTLFCPHCDHQSHVAGDWRLVETATETRYYCPDCGQTVTVRPSEDQPRPDQLWQSVLGTWAGTVQIWQGFWRRARAFR